MSLVVFPFIFFHFSKESNALLSISKGIEISAVFLFVMFSQSDRMVGLRFFSKIRDLGISLLVSHF